MMSLMEGMNVRLAAKGLNYRVGMAEWTGLGTAGQSVFFRDVGNKQLDMHFVPMDPRRSWSGDPAEGDDDITWTVDQSFDGTPPLGGLTESEATAAIGNAMATWSQVNCSMLELTEVSSYGLNVGVLAYDISQGGVGSPFIFADIQHAGFTELDFSGAVLGATFTYFFIDTSTGEPTDIDRNGKLDVAFREIYYDPSWNWVTSLDPVGPFDIDVESIAVHEAGHGLSQAHFGTLFQTDQNGKYHFAPKALLNAGYVGPQRELMGSDTGGHCSIWASWPNN